MTAYFDRTGGIPAAFATLDAQGLTGASGDTGTGAQRAGMYGASQFLDSISGPDLGARQDDEPRANAYAADLAAPVAERFGHLSYAAGELSGGTDSATRAAWLQHRLDTGFADGAQRPAGSYAAWGSVIGGGISLDGNPGIGSQAVSGSAVGIASGFDWTDGATRAGIGLGASWSHAAVAGLGTASTGNFTAGVRGSHDFGRAYVSGALAYGLHATSTTRSFGGETYTGSFVGHSISGRAEAGWRFRTAAADILPFAAMRVVSLSTPAYAETGSGAGAFALSYGAATSAETRSEVGLRLHKTIDGASGGTTTFSGMLGWAHYFSRGGSTTAGFTGLPGTSFVTRGAGGASDTALLSLGVSHRFASGLDLSLAGDGEFGAGTVSYSARGKLTLRW